MKEKLISLHSKLPYAIKYRIFEIYNSIIVAVIGTCAVRNISPTYLHDFQEGEFFTGVYDAIGMYFILGGIIVATVLLRLKSEYVRKPSSVMLEILGYVMVMSGSLALLLGYFVFWDHVASFTSGVLGSLIFVSEIILSSLRIVTLRIKLWGFKDNGS